MRIWVLGLAALAAAAASSPSRAGAGQASPAIDKAVAAIKAEDWLTATEALEPLTNQGCDALALYLTGVVAAHRDSPDETADAELTALGCEPPLQSNYHAGAISLLKWSVVEARKTAIALRLTAAALGPEQLQKVLPISKKYSELADKVLDAYPSLKTDPDIVKSSHMSDAEAENMTTAPAVAMPEP